MYDCIVCIGPEQRIMNAGIQNRAITAGLCVVICIAQMTNDQDMHPTAH